MFSPTGWDINKVKMLPSLTVALFQSLTGTVVLLCCVHPASARFWSGERSVATACWLCRGTVGTDSQASSILPSCCQTGSLISDGSLLLQHKPACWCLMMDIRTCHSFQQTLRGPLFCRHSKLPDGPPAPKFMP